MSENTSPIRLIVSGQSGTGKSRVISILEQLVSKQLKCNGLSVQVVVVAPTGLAAFNIGGTTIHRLLCLPVEHGKPTDYKRKIKTEITLLQSYLSGGER